MEIESFANDRSGGGATSQPYKAVGRMRALTTFSFASYCQGFRCSRSQSLVALAKRSVMVALRIVLPRFICPPKSLVVVRQGT